MKKTLLTVGLISIVSIASADYDVFDVKLSTHSVSEHGNNHHKYQTDRFAGVLVVHTDTNDVRECSFVLYDKKDYAQMECAFEVDDVSHNKNSGKGLFVAKLALEPYDNNSPDMELESLVIGSWKRSGKGFAAGGKGVAVISPEDGDDLLDAGYSKNVNIRYNGKSSYGMNHADDPEEYLEEQIARRMHKNAKHVDIDLHD